MRVMAVVQFGLAMIPACNFMSAALISGITSGTESSMRNALELSMTAQPALAAKGANSFEMPPPALNNAMSMPWNESLPSSLIAISSPRNLSFLPMERAEARRVKLAARKLRLSRVLIISRPTAPVAPTTATCGLRFITKRTQIYRPGDSCQPPEGVLAPGENIQLHEGNHVESTTERDSAFAAVKMMR